LPKIENLSDKLKELINKELDGDENAWL
jgi:hypothetical protein